MKKQSAKKPTAPTPLRSLPEIVTEIDKALTYIADVETRMQRATLADRVWIGVLCLGGQEHHAITDPAKRGQGRKPKEITSTRRSDSSTALSKVHPQGFLAWVADTVAGTAQPTVYKYMAAARALGFDAWTTEQEARDIVAARVQEWDERHGKQLTLAALAAQGKSIGDHEPPRPPTKPSREQLKYEAIQEFTHQAEQLTALKDAFTPKEHEAITNKLANTLHTITGFEWSPVLPK